MWGACRQTSEGSWIWRHLTYWRTVQANWLGSSRGYSTSPCLSRLSDPAWSCLSSSLWPKNKPSPVQWLQVSSFDSCGDEVLIRNHIMFFISTTFNPYQFAYRDNRSTDVTVATALHAVLSHWPHSTCLWPMRPPAGMRWSIWQCGVENTTCSCTLQKPRGLLWTSAFLGINISEDLIWEMHIAEVMKKERDCFLSILTKNNMPWSYTVWTSTFRRIPRYLKKNAPLESKRFLGGKMARGSCNLQAVLH